MATEKVQYSHDLNDIVSFKIDKSTWIVKPDSSSIFD